MKSATNREQTLNGNGRGGRGDEDHVFHVSSSLSSRTLNPRSQEACLMVLRPVLYIFVVISLSDRLPLENTDQELEMYSVGI